MSPTQQQQQQQRRRHRASAAILVALTLSWIFLGDDSSFFGGDDDDALPTLEGERHRFLRLAPNATRPEGDEVVTVHLVRTGRPNPAYSVFQTDVLRRYGSGRVDFDVVEGRCDRTCVPNEGEGDEEGGGIGGGGDEAPCLAVAAERNCALEQLKCTFPKCKTMVTNDEQCKASLYDAREYYSDEMPRKGYLPLGPRFDAWTSFQEIRRDRDFHIAPASERKYAFNAVFSQSTNSERKKLARLVARETFANSSLQMFQTTARKWNPDANDPRTEQLPTDEYARALLDSAFTLAPAGHNPECFRLFEAVEAGSVPVLVEADLNDDGREGAPCREALRHWRDAPVLVLKSWDELYPAVEEAMKDPEALDARQRDLRRWYDEYMTRVVGGFEEFMLRSHSTVARA